MILFTLVNGELRVSLERRAGALNLPTVAALDAADANPVVVDLSAGVKKTPAFVAITPTGRLPAFVDRDADDALHPARGNPPCPCRAIGSARDAALQR